MEAIVVRRFDWSETSRLVHLVTPDLGKVRILARGVHRASSPWRGLFDHWNLLRISLRFHPEQELQSLEGAQLVEHFPGLRRKLDTFLAANYATELVAMTFQVGDTVPGMYAAYRRLLETLCDAPLRRRSLLLAFELRLLDALGLRPSLTACARCGRNLPAAESRRTWALFQVASGGLVCSTCRKESVQDDDPSLRGAWRRVRIECLRAGERLLLTAPDTSSPSALSPTCETSLRKLVDEFLTYHLEQAPRSRTHLRW